MGPAMNHYRCYTAYIPKTRTERVTDTVTFIPSAIPIPSYNNDDKIKKALNDILTVLKSSENSSSIVPHTTNSNAIKKVAEILRR